MYSDYIKCKCIRYSKKEKKAKVVRLNKRVRPDFIISQNKNAKTMGKTYHAKRKQKKGGVAVKNIIRDKEGHLIIAKI